MMYFSMLLLLAMGAHDASNEKAVGSKYAGSRCWGDQDCMFTSCSKRGYCEVDQETDVGLNLAGFVDLSPVHPRYVFDCVKGKVAGGHGTVFRTSSVEECMQKFALNGDNFVYFAGSEHCQATTGKNPSSNKDWTLCTSKPAVEEAVEEAVGNCIESGSWAYCDAYSSHPVYKYRNFKNYCCANQWDAEKAVGATDYNCVENRVAAGVGHITRESSLADCQARFAGSTFSFVYYAASKHCQATYEKGVQNMNGWTLCTYQLADYGVEVTNPSIDGEINPEADEEAGIFMFEQAHSTALDQLVVYSFAIVGLVSLIYGVYAQFTAAKSAEFTPIVEDV